MCSPKPPKVEEPKAQIQIAPPPIQEVDEIGLAEGSQSKRKRLRRGANLVSKRSSSSLTGLPLINVGGL